MYVFHLCVDCSDGKAPQYAETLQYLSPKLTRKTTHWEEQKKHENFMQTFPFFIRPVENSENKQKNVQSQF